MSKQIEELALNEHTFTGVFRVQDARGGVSPNENCTVFLYGDAREIERVQVFDSNGFEIDSYHVGMFKDRLFDSIREHGYEPATDLDRRLGEEIPGRIRVDILAWGWNETAPEETPHWDGVHHQLISWLEAKCHNLDPIPRECIVRLGDGQTAEDIALPQPKWKGGPICETGIGQYDLNMVAPSVFQRGGTTLLSVEIEVVSV